MSQFCRICNGLRDTVSVRGKTCCAGCGSFAANVHVPESRANKPVKKCPQCKSSKISVLEPGRFECDNCYAIFEELEQSFVDSRPDKNLEKKERDHARR